MANSITIGELTDLQVKIPVEGTNGWASLIRDEFVKKIVEHNHSGQAGQGRKIGAGSIDANIVTDQEIRLRNNEYLRARNAADDGDIDILKVNGSNIIELASSLASLGIIADLTVGGNTSLAGTLNIAGKTTVSTINLTPVSSDPASPVEGDIQYSDGSARTAGPYVYTSGSWVPITPPSASTPIKTIKRSTSNVSINGSSILLNNISFLNGNLGNNNTYEVLVEGIVDPDSSGAEVTFSAVIPYTEGLGTTVNDNISFNNAPFTGAFSFKFRFTTQNTLGGQPYSGNLQLFLSRVGGSLNSTLRYARAEITEVGTYTEGNF